MVGATSKQAIPGFDMAWGVKPYDAAAREGLRFVLRYLSHDDSKDLTRQELAEWHRRRIAVGVVWESTGNRALVGRSAGVADALAAEAKLEALGLPKLPVYFAVDFPAEGSQLETVRQYMLGAASILGHARTGAYGGYDTVDYLLQKGAIAYVWQTYAWSSGRIHPKAHLHQYRNGVTIGGASCDLDHALRPDPGLSLPISDESARKRRVWRRHLVLARQKLHDLLAARRRLRHDGKTRTARYAWTTTRLHVLETHIALLERLIRR